MYQLNLTTGTFEPYYDRDNKVLEFIAPTSEPFDWKDLNPVLIYNSNKELNSINFVLCGSNANNQPSINQGSLVFENNNITFKTLELIDNLPKLIYKNQKVSPIYYECPQKITVDQGEILLCSVGIKSQNSSEIEHFLVGYIKKQNKWELANRTGIININYPQGYELYAPKALVKNNKIYIVGWNAEPSGLPYSQSTLLELDVNITKGEIKVV